MNFDQPCAAANSYRSARSTIYDAVPLIAVKSQIPARTVGIHPVRCIGRRGSHPDCLTMARVEVQIVTHELGSSRCDGEPEVTGYRFFSIEVLRRSRPCAK